MKRYKKYMSLTYWIALIKKQPVHMQHVYALLFSGVITTIIAIIILYSNYGFWRDTYIRSDTGVATGNGDTNIITESPKDVIGSFLEEASVRLRAISADKKEFFEGTEVYR